MKTAKSESRTIVGRYRSTSKPGRTLLVVLLALATGFAGCKPTPKIAAMSLRALVEAVGAGAVPEEAQTLGGMREIIGFVVDEGNQDVVILGATDSGPTLWLADLVAALGNNRDSAVRPGCSIDPTESTVKLMNELSQRASQEGSIQAKDAVMEEMKERWTASQDVRVFGVGRHTRFAQVMVAADYLCKRVADGTADLRGVELAGTAERRMKDMEQRARAGETTGSQMVMSRFWFYPGTVDFVGDGKVVLLETCQVRLLTEQQLATAEGKLHDAAEKEPYAQAFVADFTKRYAEIARAAPIYADLCGLFQEVALAEGLDQERAFERVRLDISSLLSLRWADSAGAPMTLPGIANLRRVVVPADNGDVHLWLASCGGVHMNITRQSAQVRVAGDGPTIRTMERTWNWVRRNRAHRRLFMKVPDPRRTESPPAKDGSGVCRQSRTGWPRRPVAPAAAAASARPLLSCRRAA